MSDKINFNKRKFSTKTILKRKGQFIPIKAKINSKTLYSKSVCTKLYPTQLDKSPLLIINTQININPLLLNVFKTQISSINKAYNKEKQQN